jgi:hypothetical protein
MAEKPFMRELTLRLPRALWPPKRYGHVMSFSEDGKSPICKTDRVPTPRPPASPKPPTASTYRTCTCMCWGGSRAEHRTARKRRSLDSIARHRVEAVRPSGRPAGSFTRRGGTKVRDPRAREGPAGAACDPPPPLERPHSWPYSPPFNSYCQSVSALFANDYARGRRPYETSRRSTLARCRRGGRPARHCRGFSPFATA